MKPSVAKFFTAGWVCGGILLLFLHPANALSQTSGLTGMDGAKARSILDLQMNHASISVANIDAEADWYIQTLGFTFRAGEKIDQINPMMRGCRLVIPGFQLDLIQYKGSQRPATPSPVFSQQGYFHLTFTVPDLESAFNFLQSAGVKLTANRDKQNRIRGIVLNDPEGNEIELSAR